MVHGKLYIAPDGGRRWVVEVPPHLAIRLKRVFPRLGTLARDAFVLSDTPEVARDLSWFCERHPLTMSDEARAHLVKRSEEHKEKTAVVDALLSGARSSLPVELAIPAREYQKAAASLYLATGGLLLGDDLGTGKSCAAICSFCDERALPALVVTMTALPGQWRREIQKFAPALRVAVLQSGMPYDLTRGCRSRHDFTEKAPGNPSRCRKCGARPSEIGRPLPPPDVIVTSYSKLEGWGETLASLAEQGGIANVIFDECMTADTAIQRWPVSAPPTALIDLRPGDAIAAFDESGRIVEDRVVGTTFKGRRQVWRLTLDDGRHLDCTDNERVLTERGWVYAREIIHEAFARNETESPYAAVGDEAAVGARLPAWRCQSRSTTDRPSAALPSRPGASGVRRPQGDHPGPIRRDEPPIGTERGLRDRLVRIHDGDHASLRVLALALSSGWTEDGHGRMARYADVGGGGVLVHGRRTHERKQVWTEDGRRRQHPFLHRGRGVAAVGVAGDPRTSGAGRSRDHELGTSLLDASIQPEGRERSGRSYSSVRAGVHGLQGAGSASDRDGALRWVRGGYAEEKSSSRSLRQLRQAVVQDGRPESLVGIERLAPSTVVRAESIGVREVWDVETERHHTLIANGFAVHNCQELRRAFAKKGEPTKKYAAAKLIADRVQFRLGLSATPIFNWGSEFYNVMECLRPDALGSSEEFLTEWCEGSYSGDQSRIKDPKAFGLYIRQEGLMLRRTRAEVGRELPALTDVLHRVEANLDALDSVGDRCAELARFIVGIDKAPPRGASTSEMGPVSPEDKKKGAQMLASEELSWKLRQATGIAKAPWVAEFVRLVAEQEKKILLVAWHRAVYDLYLDLLGGAHGLEDLKPVMHTGSESSQQKERAREAFVDGDSRVLIMSLRSGAGVDGLQKCCRTIVYGELDWSPAVHAQMSGRPHRDGQTDPVFAYYLYSDEGSDPIVMDVLGLKGQQASGIIDPEAEMVQKLSGGGHHVKKLAEAYLAQREKRERRRIERGEAAQ